MVSQPVQSAPLSKFTLGGFAFPSRQEIKKKPVEEDEWYIPYNGPYEPPRESHRRAKNRDSWGDALDDFEDGDMLGDRELHIRYGGDFQSRQHNERDGEVYRKDGGRDRSFSVNSGRTTSSGAMDPGRGSLTINRRSTVSAANPPPLPSYVSLNPSGGGVGESPMPHLKSAKEHHRISIASIFSLGGSNRKSVASHTPERVKSTTRQIRPQQSHTEIQEKQIIHSKVDTSNIGDSPGGQHKSKLGKSKRLRDQVKAQNERMDSIITNKDTYYNTYYQSLSQQTDHDHARLSPTYQSRSPTASSHSRNSSIPQQEALSRPQNFATSDSSRHPYANAISSLAIPPLPQTAPPTSAPSAGFNTNNPPKLTFTTVDPSTAGPSSAVPRLSRFPLGGKGSAGLKNSISTPNLRSPISSSSGSGNEHPAEVVAPKFIFPKGKERWLSAETWCDALLFPRPRLRIKQDFKHGIEGQKLAEVAVSGMARGRIVSPPTTPTEQRNFEVQQGREPGIASRVLAHSRSLVDLRLNKGKKKEKAEAIHPSILQDSQPSRPTGQGQTLRPPRPKSFAWDDLALPSPVPSLAHVLREGEMLATERKAWQQQAQGSFGNKHSRTISRTRSKSLTQKGHKKLHNHQSSIEYIAAQACLGTQNHSPAIAAPRLSYFTDGTSATTSRGTHSHSNSLVKTLSKSSKSHSRNHSRNESWSKSAMRVVTKPLAALSSTEPTSHTNSKAADLEGALRSQGTKFIRLADPVHLPLNRGTAQNTQRQTPSPAFSNISDSRVGIALGTPPEEAAVANYIPSHPYAHGGLSFNTAPALVPAEYAGPHRSINTHGTKIPAISDILARHKLPPHIALHPYAQTSNRDSYLNMNGLVGQLRSDHIPGESKMWAQLSPSAEVVHEVLPDDLQYSPFSPEGSTSRGPNRNTMNIRDTVGLGEALVSAVNASRFRRASPDSGLGTSESHEPNQPASQQHQSNVQNWESSVEQSNLAEVSSGLQGNILATSLRIDNPDNGQASMFLRPHAVSNHTLASSNDIYLPVPPFDPAIRHPSPTDTSSSYSPNQSSRIIGSPNDLESFQDLFFRPSVSSTQRTPNEAALPETPSTHLRSSAPWDASLRTHRTNSSLTNLARQLSEEFEQMALDRDMSDPHSGLITSSRQTSLGRQLREDSLQFLFEDVSMSVSPPDDRMDDTIQAFKPTGRLPEDVLSSRASSFIEGTAEDDDPTVVYRVGIVESVSTPPPMSSEHRSSYAGQTTFAGDNTRHGLSSPSSDAHARILSGLQPPLTDITRSSYTSASTLSRISNLSDFPVPPKDPDHPTSRHMSLLSSYFDEAMSQSDSRPTPLSRDAPLLEEDRVTFGGNQNADDLAKTLSSPNPEPF